MRNLRKSASLRRVLPLLAVLAAVALPAAANAATGQFGTTAPGGAWGCPPADYKYGNEYTLTENGSVTKITAWMKGNGGSADQTFRTMIYAADGAGGKPGTLLATSASVTVSASAAPGAVDFAITPAVSLAAGDYWIAQQSGPASGGACLSTTPNGSNSFNPDPFGDGPSNPFDASGSILNDANVWTLSATYETAAADTTAPTITATASPAPNANGWNNGNVTVTFGCIDNPGGSGVDTVSAPVTLSSEGAGQSATGTCTDKAGNPASATASGINIDKTAPTVTYSGNAGTYDIADTISISCNASDTLSGIATSTCANVNEPAYSAGPGSHTVSASATDKAGNSGTGSATFQVKVSAGGLCNLTEQFVESSARYQSLPGRARGLANAIWNGACRTVAAVTPRLGDRQKRLAVGLYGVLVRGAAHQGWLTDGQADTLTDLAGDL